MSPEEFSNICEEYDKAPDDYAWDEDHPIFQLAQESDYLKKVVREQGDYIRDKSKVFREFERLEQTIKDQAQQIEELQQELGAYKAAECNDPKAWPIIVELQARNEQLVEAFNGAKEWLLSIMPDGDTEEALRSFIHPSIQANIKRHNLEREVLDKALEYLRMPWLHNTYDEAGFLESLTNLSNVIEVDSDSNALSNQPLELYKKRQAVIDAASTIDIRPDKIAGSIAKLNIALANLKNEMEKG